ncbi:receptor-like protein EIX2 [Vitis riparia]|uniref:receptor-like protein EIX2 n=1 Tax=Vitis riparia TaxID=96939 RepID=UPI00155AB81D|nr:receptor-like protein EIX2 [Vitis riparia]
MEKISILGFILAILYFITTELACNGHTRIDNNVQSEQKALIDFKSGLKDPNNRLSSWKGSNYCYWQGISCENGTGFVISIELHNPYPRENEYENWSSMNLSGEISPSLIKLKSLKYLDLSFNSFKAMPIPQFFGSLKNLIYLNLSGAGFSGSIPSNLRNLSSLQYLDLSSKYLDDIDSKYLYEIDSEYFNNLFVENIEWMTDLVFLKYLGMNYVNLSLVGSRWVEVANKLPSLTELHLGGCSLFGSIPLGLGELPNLQYLDLSSNVNLSGSISQLLRKNWKKIEFLNLHGNGLHGSIPSFIGNFCNLKYLDLSDNLLNGSLPEIIQGLETCSSKSPLPNLTELYLYNNQLMGKLPNWLGELKNLRVKTLDFSNSCHLGPSFPAWLQSQKNLQLNLSHNQLQGNRIIGTIPDSIGHITSLEVIDFSRNNLTGSIPSAINNCSGLFVLDLGNNNLSGIIPKSLGQLQSLQSLHLNHNKLLGELPSSFQNLTGLDVLDLSYNRLLGQVPAWIGVAFVNLVILNLRSNMFSGRLPSRLSNLSSLHVLDLAQNNLMGKIPITLVELKAMAQEKLNIYKLNENVGSSYEERLVVISKGQSLEYTKTLSLVVGIDLSDNNLSGEFPQEITKLFGLVVLNLSRNHITGQIPESISMLRQLLSLDLSSNKLSGTIPSSMASLSFLSYLNLSNNNFSSKIPFIGQMTTFTELAFVGNPDLCGAPLTTKCQDEDPNKRQSVVSDKNDGGYVDQWFYLSVGLGFAMGILVPFFVLATRKSWCEAYFDFVDEIVKWLLRGRATYAKNHPRRR